MEKGGAMNKLFNFENCEFVGCPLCNSNSKWPDSLDAFTPCLKCGGLGFITRVKNTSEKKIELTEITKDLSFSNVA